MNNFKPDPRLVELSQWNGNKFKKTSKLPLWMQKMRHSINKPIWDKIVVSLIDTSKKDTLQ